MALCVFVYGTLRRHESNHGLMRGAKRISGQAHIFARLWDTGLGYPVAVPHPEDRVYGELYEVDADILAELDELEGYTGPEGPNEYDRVTCAVYTEGGRREAYVYVVYEPPEDGVRLVSGDWKWERLVRERSDFYYFSYGSDDMAERLAGGGCDLGPAVLRDHVLTVSGAEAGRALPDLAERVGERVEGRLFRVERDALRDLFFPTAPAAGEVPPYRPAFVDVEFRGRTLADAVTRKLRR
ncbi:MAG TPA: gamma-glutamylcyclotransferase [Paenibacillaceae bacterium]